MGILTGAAGANDDLGQIPAKYAKATVRIGMDLAPGQRPLRADEWCA